MGNDRFKVFTASHVFLIRNHTIFLLRRYNTGYQDGKYNVSQGHIEEGETASACAIRETKEESGVIVAQKHLTCVHIMHRRSLQSRTPHRVYVDFFFVARKWRGEPTLAEPTRCDRVGWFPLDHLPKNIIPYIRQALTHYRKGISFSQFGWN